LTEAEQIADKWKGYCEDLYGTRIKKEKELNKNIGSKSLHHFILSWLVPSVRQQVAKPQVLMRPNRTVQSRRRDSTGQQNAQNMCGDLGNW